MSKPDEKWDVWTCILIPFLKLYEVGRVRRSALYTLPIYFFRRSSAAKVADFLNDFSKDAKP